ncbi:hypothetical protein KKF84_03880 [Myxococcota bacterium]|nr:hypothetical protein [Myxococcota bacterium]
MMKFEYQVCQVQGSKVTFVNGKFQSDIHITGAVDPASMDSAMESCPSVWKYLNKVGREGWELVTSGVMSTSDEGSLQILYLKRAV